MRRCASRVLAQVQAVALASVERHQLKGREISSHMGSARGMPIRVSTRCMAFTYHGGRSLTPGNGLDVRISMAGACRAYLRWGLSWICSRGCRELIAWVTWLWS